MGRGETIARCLESCADVLKTVVSRNSLRRLRVLPHEFWTAWRGRAWRPDKPPTAALRRQQPDQTGCCGVWATAQTVTVGTVHCCSVHALGPALSAEVFQRRPHSFPLSTE